MRILTTDVTPSGERAGSEVRGQRLNPALILLTLGLPYLISCQHLKIRIFYMKTWISGFSWKIRSDNSGPNSPPLEGCCLTSTDTSWVRCAPVSQARWTLRAFEASASGIGASPLPSGGHLQYCMESLWALRSEGWKDE